MPYFSIAGEGLLDLAVARKILEQHSHDISYEFDLGGKDKLDKSLSGYLNASRHSPWLILRDLDREECAPSLLEKIAPNRSDFSGAVLRVCVKAVEAWVLADRQGFARHFGLAAATIPSDPEALADPKVALVTCISRSRHRNLREGVVPRQGSGRQVGPEYNAVLIDFVRTNWDLTRATEVSASLRRTVERVAAFQ